MGEKKTLRILKGKLFWFLWLEGIILRQVSLPEGKEWDMIKYDQTNKKIYIFVSKLIVIIWIWRYDAIRNRFFRYHIKNDICWYTSTYKSEARASPPGLSILMMAALNLFDSKYKQREGWTKEMHNKQFALAKVLMMECCARNWKWYCVVLKSSRAHFARHNLKLINYRTACLHLFLCSQGMSSMIVMR